MNWSGMPVQFSSVRLCRRYSRRPFCSAVCTCRATITCCNRRRRHCAKLTPRLRVSVDTPSAWHCRWRSVSVHTVTRTRDRKYLRGRMFRLSLSLSLSHTQCRWCSDCTCFITRRLAVLVCGCLIVLSQSLHYSFTVTVICIGLTVKYRLVTGSASQSWEAATDWQQLMMPQRIMRPSIARTSETIGPAVQPADVPPPESATPGLHLAARKLLPSHIPLRVGGWVDMIRSSRLRWIAAMMDDTLTAAGSCGSSLCNSLSTQSQESWASITTKPLE